MENQILSPKLESDKILYQISSLTHDLKNPVSTSWGFLCLLETCDNTEKKKRYITMLKRSMQDIILMFELSVDLARLCSLKIKETRQDFSVKEVLKDLLSYFGLRKHEKEDIEIIIESTLDELRSDKIRFEQVLKVILHLAHQYTSGRKIFLNISQEKILIEFEDQATLKPLFLEFEERYPDIDPQKEILRNQARTSLALIFVSEFSSLLKAQCHFRHFENLAQIELTFLS